MCVWILARTVQGGKLISDEPAMEEESMLLRKQVETGKTVYLLWLEAMARDMDRSLDNSEDVGGGNRRIP